MKLKTKLKTLVTLLFFTCSLLFAEGQLPGDPGDPGGDPGGGVQDTNAPIDGGLGLLIAAGVGYGIRKVHDRKKSEKNVLNNSAENI